MNAPAATAPSVEAELAAVALAVAHLRQDSGPADFDAARSAIVAWLGQLAEALQADMGLPDFGLLSARDEWASPELADLNPLAGLLPEPSRKARKGKAR